VGRDGDVERLQDAIEKRGLGIGVMDLCRRLGPSGLQVSELRGLHAVLVAGVGPSDRRLSEAGRFAVVAAFGLRLPLIAAPVDELRHLSDSGCLIETEWTHEAVLIAISRVLDDVELTTAMTTRAWRHYQRRFSSSAVRCAIDLIEARLR
jgi:hypothetical protein